MTCKSKHRYREPYDEHGICRFCGGHENGHFYGDCQKSGDWYGTHNYGMSHCKAINELIKEKPLASS